VTSSFSPYVSQPVATFLRWAMSLAFISMGKIGGKVLILIAIGIAGYGLYIATNSHLEAGVLLTAAGVFSFVLALQVSDLKDRLDWAKAENQKLAKKVSNAAQKANPAKPRKNPPKVSEPEYYIPEPPPEVDDDFDPRPEESIWVEPDPTPVKPLPLVSGIDSRKIVTRTSRAAGGYVQETWKGEHSWSPDEIGELIELYSEGDILDSIAIKMRLDKKDVVYRLTRLSFGDSGELEDLSEAPNDGKAWSKEDSNKLLEMNSAGITLNGMAKTFGRTKLAIGWRLADQRELRNIG
jgi:hypothetical protein